MSKYYIYCSNNQAYHAVIHNSIMAKAMMREDFRSDTAAYLSKDYVFVTKQRLSDAVRFAGVPEAYYSVALEIEADDETSGILAYFVTKNEEGSVSLSDPKKLSEYDQMDRCLGAFICGEIPITYLSGILFNNDEQKQQFNKSSQDLWFPEELKRVWKSGEISDDITMEVLRDAAEKVDAILTEEDAQALEMLVVKRNRVKAAAYYAVEATKDWNIGSVRANVDAELVKYLDRDDELAKGIRDAFTKLGEKCSVTYEDFIAVKDVVFDPEPTADINYQLFWHIIGGILCLVPVRTKISEEAFNKIAGELMDCAKDEGQEFLAALKTVSHFLNSNMDPDEALQSLGKYDVLRAFMIFLDQQETADFLRRAATKLSQQERRYAYIMYGALNGMSEVEREFKENRYLEYRIEEKIFEKYSDEKLINTLPDLDKCVFLQGYSTENTIGLVPDVNIWYDCKSSQEMLLTITDEKLLEKIYQAMAKSVKDDPIPEQDIYSFQNPIVITISEEDQILESFTITRKKDAKDYGKKIEKTLKKLKEDFNAEGFKQYLKDEKRYQKFYRKNTDLVQECCRKVQ